jgi:hypothetical protein
MPKPNPLTQGLEQQPTARVATSTARPLKIARPTLVPPSRSGRVLVAGHFAPEVQIALKIIAAEERTTVQALLAEGINTVFAKRRKPEIAEFSTAS